MAKRINWFKDIFLKSFKDGEQRISEKQYYIFTRYLKVQFIDGYTEGVKDEIDGYKITATLWHCITGDRFYLNKEVINK